MPVDSDGNEVVAHRGVPTVHTFSIEGKFFKELPDGEGWKEVLTGRVYKRLYIGTDGTFNLYEH